MSESPHTPKFRALVSQEYLDGLGSYDFRANKHQAGSKTRSVVAVLSGAGSFDDIVAKYNISG